MNQSASHLVDVPRVSRTDVPPVARGRTLRSQGRQLIYTSAISAALVVALLVADWTIWGRSSFNTLLVLAALLLTAAAVTGLRGLPRRPLLGDAAPLAVHGKAVSASVQNLLFELGLLVTLSWIVDVFLKVFKLT